MLRARPTLLHFRVSLPTQPLPRPAGSGVLDIFSGFGGGAPHLQSQGKAPRGRDWTFSIKLLTFSGLKCAVSLYFAQTLLRSAKRAQGCQNSRKFCFQHQRCSKVTQVF